MSQLDHSPLDNARIGNGFEKMTNELKERRPILSPGLGAEVIGRVTKGLQNGPDLTLKPDESPSPAEGKADFLGMGDVLGRAQGQIQDAMAEAKGKMSPGPALSGPTPVPFMLDDAPSAKLHAALGPPEPVEKGAIDLGIDLSVQNPADAPAVEEPIMDKLEKLRLLGGSECMSKEDPGLEA